MRGRRTRSAVAGRSSASGGSIRPVTRTNACDSFGSRAAAAWSRLTYAFATRRRGGPGTVDFGQGQVGAEGEFPRRVDRARERAQDAAAARALSGSQVVAQRERL